jgi:alpha-1,3-glucosyltransferase
MASSKQALLSTSLAVAAVSAVALLRVLVGYQPHSGQDNYHGSHATYGGDFECQRHWMELTWQLPLSEWYWYDLEYWGLDYPPLTAYVSWLCGALSSLLVGPESVALETSRGLEDPLHKAYMRGTVLVLDLLLYGSIVWVATRPRRPGSDATTSHDTQSIWFFLLAMAQPAILLIDHGHFQYNTTALGLALWSFYYMTKAGFRDCVVGSFLFCCALSFKQMTLYYAPAVFCYLLGRCFAPASNAVEKGTKFLFSRFVALGVTVLVTFALLWWPFVVYGPDETTALDRILHVLRRIIPLQRGLFEGKVSNIWCVLSVKPIRIRERFPAELQPLAALALTLLLVLPSGYKLFRTGQEQSQRAARQAKGQEQGHRGPSGESENDWKILLWGTTSSALAFFLASFQVHEKSLLLALAPASLLFADDALFTVWFSLIAAWTMWPLLVLDRLQTAYVCTMLIFAVAVQLYKLLHPESSSAAAEAAATDSNVSTSFFRSVLLFRWILALSYVAMLVLHGAELVVTVPSHLPDLFPVLWSIVGCGFCCLAWLGTCWHLYQNRRPTKAKSV